MNMISTGAFQTEINASHKQPNLAEKFVAVWEKKNAKVVRAGGVSLMALSLAACGSDDDTAATTTTTTTTTTTVAEPEPVTPTLAALTNGTDTISASGAIDAGMVWSPGGDTRTESLQSEDTVTGTGTADSISIVTDGGTIAPTLNSIETININNTGADAAILNVASTTGTTSINVSSSQGNVDIRSIQSASIDLKVHDVSDNATVVAFNMSSEAVTGTTAVDLAVDSFDGSQILVGSSAAAAGPTAGAGVETLSLSASGGESVVANIGSTGVTTLNVDADAKLTVSALSATGITTMDLTGSTAVTSINAAANVSANVFAYTGGSGNDTLIINSGFTGTDSFDGGDGADTLRINDAAGGGGTVTVGALNAASASVVSNVETLDMRSADADFTVDMDHVAGVTAVSMRATEAADTLFTLNDLTPTQAANLTLTNFGSGATTDGSVTVDIKTNTAADSVVLNATVTADSQEVDLEDTAANEFEIATVNLSGDFNTILDIEAATFLTSVTVTGGAATKSLTTNNAYSNTTVDMSDVASNITFTTGGAAQTVTTGAGNDTITSNAGDKTINLGAGNDSLTTGAAAITAADSFEGGEGTDTLVVTTPVAITAAIGAKITGFERININDGGMATNTINLNNIGSTFARITMGDTNNTIQTFSGVQADFTDLRISAAAAADTQVTLTRQTDTTTNAMDITLIGGETATVVANDEETVSVTGSGAGTVRVNLTSTDMTALTITGANVVDMATTAIANSTLLATVDATAATGAVSVNASVSTVDAIATANTLGGVFTYTGGSGDDTITGGNAADNLTGGSGNDTINGGSGNEAAINGGAGNDTINGGAGNDVMNGGTGNDIVDGGSGADVITYTDGLDTITVGAGSDTVHITTNANSAVATDGATITDFNAGLSTTQVDDIEIDLAQLNALDGIFATAMDVLVRGNATDVTTGDVVFQTITADGTAAIAGTEMLLLDIGTFESDADIMAAFAAGSLSVTTTAVDDNDGMLMAYKTGSGDVNIGVGQFNTAATTTDNIDGFITLVTLQDFNDFSLLSAGDITIV
jgi:Ca2+-binding RTX toxin-like protein